MRVYLARYGDTQSTGILDPYSVPLSAAGQEQATDLAAASVTWDVQLICASVTQAAQESADVVSASLPYVERWDVDEIEDMNVDDLLGEPTASPHVSAWTDEQLALGIQRTWVRTMAFLSRLLLYAEDNDVATCLVISGPDVAELMLLNWLGHDWRSRDRLSLQLDPGAAACVDVLPGGEARIVWRNRSSGLVRGDGSMVHTKESHGS